MKLYRSTIHRVIIDPNKDQLSVGLIAKFIEYSTGVAEVRVKG